jgi:hypothetical protein
VVAVAAPSGGDGGFAASGSGAGEGWAGVPAWPVAATRASCFLRARFLDNMPEVSTTVTPGGWIDPKTRPPTTRGRVLSSPDLGSDLHKR